MPRVDDGDEWLPSAENLGKISTDGSHAEGRQIVIDEADHVGWSHPRRSKSETFNGLFSQASG